MEIETVTKLEEDGNITDYTEDGLFAMIKNDDDYYINLTRKQWHMVAKKPLRDYYGQYVIQLRVSRISAEQVCLKECSNIFAFMNKSIELKFLVYYVTIMSIDIILNGHNSSLIKE